MKRHLTLVVACMSVTSFFSLETKAAKPNTYTPVPLVVQILDQDSSLNDCRICDDGMGAYEDGVDAVEASIDKYGNLIINFQSLQNPPLRSVYFDFSQPLAAQGHIPPPAWNQPHAYLSTVPGPNNVPIQNLPLGSSQCVQLGWTFTLDDPSATQWRMSFHRSLSNFDVSQTSYGVVTRIDADTWEVEPSADACNTGIPTVAKVFDTPTKGKFQFTDDGLYSMPFKLILTRKI